MRNWYSPGGTPAMANFPLACVTAYHGVFNTAIIALIVACMLQKTRTMPACRNVTAFDVRGAYRPTSNGWPLKFEKALRKIKSRFGRSTVLPSEIATTRSEERPLGK